MPVLTRSQTRKSIIEEVSLANPVIVNTLSPRIPAHSTARRTHHNVTTRPSTHTIKTLHGKLKNFKTSISAIFKIITIVFNFQTQSKFVKLTKIFTKYNKMKLRLSYLLTWRSFGTFPKHFATFDKSLRILNFTSVKSKRQLPKISLKFKQHILNIEIYECNFTINSWIDQINLLRLDLEKLTTKILVKNFFIFYKNHITPILIEHKKCLHKKFLYSLKLDNFATYKKYFLSSSNDFYVYNEFVSKQSSITPCKIDNSSAHFENDLNQNSMNQNKWLVNLTDTEIPEFVTDVLKLGKDFNFSTSVDKKFVFQSLKDLESSLYKTPHFQTIIRNEFKSKINFNIKNKSHIDIGDKIISKKVKLTNSFLKTHRDLHISKSDKGNTTIIIKKSEYIDKVQFALNNNLHYDKLDFDPTNKVRNCANSLIQKINSKVSSITNDVFKTPLSHVNNVNLPRAYGLIKIHKKDLPVRIIVSTVNGPTSDIEKRLVSLFNQCIPKPKHNIKNSYSFKRDVDQILVPDAHTIASLDVISLFTNIDRHLVVQVIKNKWPLLRNNIKLNKKEFLDVIIFILNSTYFKFNNQFYHQKSGAPMGGSISPWLADLCLEAIENNCLEKLKSSISYFGRYVDDIFLMCSASELTNILDTFNNYNNNIQFTLEQTNSKREINFLDMTIKIENNKLITNWYQKNISSGRYISYDSHHPIQQKKAIVYGLVDKAIKLSDKRFHHKNLDLVKKLLINNNYPIDFITLHTKNRLKKINQFQGTCTIQQSTAPKKIFFPLPFHKYFTPKISYIFKRFDINTVFRNINKIDQFQTLGKDKVDKLYKTDVIYKINCKNCDKSYIGETKRHLHKRVDDHKRYVRNNDEKSVIALHCVQNNHSFDFDKVSILDSEPQTKKRKFLEMLHIQFHKNNINKQLDTQFLRRDYKDIVQALPTPPVFLD